MGQSKVGVGVIGVGGISGHVHLPGLQLCPQAEIVALCDLNPDLLRQRAEEYGVVHTFTEYADLLQHPAVDAVVTATPTIQHAPIALAAIAAGKHVLVEKQLGMTYAETVSWNHPLSVIFDALFSAGLTLDFFHEHRFCAWEALPDMEEGEDR